MWSDNETTVDLLGFQHLVAGLVSIVANDDLLPATIGVFGDWGSGKSSLLRMAAADLRTDPEVLVLTFNGWLFEGHGDAKTTLMGNILDALAEDKTLLPQAKGLALRLLKRVNWWRIAGSVTKAGVGFAVGGPAGLGLAVGGDLATTGKELLKKTDAMKEEDLQKYLEESPEHEERRGIREFRDDFGQLLGQTKRKRLVVIIDDLDRCLPETIIETLEAIKLFLFVERTAFVIGADERLVQYAVRRRFPELPGERADVGRDYLEKLIQFPIRVPPLGRVETETYTGLLFASRAKLDGAAFEALRRAAVECDPKSLHAVRFTQDIAGRVLKTIPEELASNLSLAERVAPVLAAETLGNPRQCKRFLNMLSIRLGMAESRGVRGLQPRVLAKLMLLEYYRPESFRHLAAAQAEEEGHPSALRAAESKYRGIGAPATPADDTASTDKGSETDLPLWLLDSWVAKWVKMEPPLSEEDLRPYFYFSRDILGPLGAAAQRMSPTAQEVFKRLLSGSEAERQIGFKRAASLAPADASAVFEALAERVREEDDPNAETAALPRIIDWVKVRPDLVGQLAPLLASIPDDRIPAATPIKLVTLGRTAPGDPIGRLLEQWSTSKVEKLKGAAQAAVKRPKGR